MTGRLQVFYKGSRKIVSDTAGGQQNDRYAGEGIKYKAVCAFRT